MSQPDREQFRERFKRLPTSMVSDVLHDLGHRFQVLDTGLAPVGTDARIAGWAYTISGEMRPPRRGVDPTKAAAVSGIYAGSVSVWSGGRADGVCMFGDLLALAMQVRGSAGAIVDGGVRDVADIRELGLPVFARYRTPNRSSSWWYVTDWEKPIYMPGALGREVLTSPGDFVLGDADGVVIVPAELVESVLDRAEELLQQEVSTRADVEAGMDLRKVLEKYGRI